MNLNSKKLYTWHGINSQGIKVSGEMTTFSENFVKIYLYENKIRDFSINRKYIRFKKFKRLSAVEITVFFQQLASLISAGIPILESLEALSQSYNATTLKSILIQLKLTIQIGNSLSFGLRKYPDYFDAVICNLIHVGEYSGNLDLMLIRSTEYLTKNLRLKKQIQQAFFYPCVVSCIALSITVVMLCFVVPRFEELFQNIHGKLPYLTQIFITISKFIRKNLLLGIFVTTLTLCALHFLTKKTRFKLSLDAYILKIPFIKKIFQRLIITRFTRSFAILLNAGISITEALKVSSLAANNQIYCKAIQQFSFEINKGQQLYHAMQKSTLFPSLMTHMVKTGEESGTLDTMLDKIADLYEREADYIIFNLSQLLEPLIMIILGVLIGGLVIAMYLPIFKLGTTI